MSKERHDFDSEYVESEFLQRGWDLSHHSSLRRSEPHAIEWRRRKQSNCCLKTFELCLPISFKLYVEVGAFEDTRADFHFRKEPHLLTFNFEILNSQNGNNDDEFRSIASGGISDVFSGIVLDKHCKPCSPWAPFSRHSASLFQSHLSHSRPKARCNHRIAWDVLRPILEWTIYVALPVLAREVWLVFVSGIGKSIDINRPYHSNRPMGSSHQWSRVLRYNLYIDSRLW